MPNPEEIDNAYDAAESIFYSSRDQDLKGIAQHWCQEIALRLFSYYVRMVGMERLMSHKL